MNVLFEEDKQFSCPHCGHQETRTVYVLEDWSIDPIEDLPEYCPTCYEYVYDWIATDYYGEEDENG